MIGDYEYTKGFDVVAKGGTGMQAQPDRDGFLSKTLYGALEHTFSDRWSGFVRGYGYDNRTDYDAYYSPGSPLIDTRKLYSQAGTPGCALMANVFSLSWFQAIATVKITTMIRTMAGMIPPPRWMR